MKTFDETEKRILNLLDKGILGMESGKPVISEEYAFKMLNQFGIPTEIFEDWINNYIAHGELERTR